MADEFRTTLNRQIVLLTVGLWAAAFGLYMSPALMMGDRDPNHALLQLGCVTLGATLCALIFLSIRLSRRLPWSRRLLLVGLLAAAALALHSTADTLIARALVPAATGGAGAPVRPFASELLWNSAVLAPVYGLYISCVALSFSALANREKERRLAAAHAATQEAQLMALRFQVNPHFLFNALNAVTALVGAGRNAEAGQVVARLSSFFRATLDGPADQLIRLDEELDTIAAYLDIEAARFGDRLRPQIDCPEALADALVPHFLLQPIVENAVKHGVARSKAPVGLRIAAQARDGALRLSVTDDAASAEGPAPPGAGVGLSNVAQRLATLYGEAGRLTVARQEGRFVAEVELPLTLEPRERAAA